jgi:hypothetical protein
MKPRVLKVGTGRTGGRWHGRITMYRVCANGSSSRFVCRDCRKLI